MKRFLIILLLILNNLKLDAQDYKLVKSIEIKAQSIAVDKFDNFYIVETYKISKFNKTGQLLSTYENLNNGEISHFDISNPLKPLVYYKDFNTFSILDNKLSEINTIDLFEKNLNQTEVICSSNNMEFWIFDNIENRLQKLNKTYKIINQSESFFNLFDEIFFPSILKISNNKLYSLSNNGISIFDLYGGFIKTIKTEKINDFQIFGNQIIYIENNKLLSFNEKTLLHKNMRLPASKKEALQVKLMQNVLIERSNNNVKLYSY